MGMTYKEQLLHPNWQRRRLEILDLADFSCAKCGSTQKTLHVHHKRYVKGRMAWEYSDAELSALCLDCHRLEHRVQEAIEEELALYFQGSLESVHALLLGWRNAIVADHVGAGQTGFIDGVLFESGEVLHAFAVGQIAHRLLVFHSPDKSDDLLAALSIPGDDGSKLLQTAADLAAESREADG